MSFTQDQVQVTCIVAVGGGSLLPLPSVLGPGRRLSLKVSEMGMQFKYYL